MTRRQVRAFAQDDTGYDAAADVIARALTYLEQRTPIAEIGAGPQPAPRDVLNDMIAVLGEQRVPAADVPARLRDLAPDHAPYRGLTGIKLREILERDYWIRVASTARSRSTCRTETLPIARPTRDVDGLHHQLEHLTAVPDPVDHLATSTETTSVLGVRRGACRTEAFAMSPQCGVPEVGLRS